MGVEPVNIAMIRVGVDAGCGGIQGPLFKDGSFEFIPIPENHKFTPPNIPLAVLWAGMVSL